MNLPKTTPPTIFVNGIKTYLHGIDLAGTNALDLYQLFWSDPVKYAPILSAECEALEMTADALFAWHGGTIQFLAQYQPESLAGVDLTLPSKVAVQFDLHGAIDLPALETAWIDYQESLEPEPEDEPEETPEP